MSPLRPDALAQVADEVGVLGEALDEDGAGALERGGGVGDLAVGVDECRCSGWSGRSSGEPSSRSASGSSPASRAICALVRRFGLNGR